MENLWANLTTGEMNVPGLVGLFLVSSLGLDRLTRGVLFFGDWAWDWAAGRWLRAFERRGQEAKSAPTKEAGERFRLVSYYGTSIVLAFLIASIAKIRILDLMRGDESSAFANFLVAALVIAFGGEGLSNLLELGDPAAPAAQKAAEPAPVELFGEVVLTPVAEIVAEPSEG